MILAHWIYTREEWRLFHYWRLRRKSLLHYWFYRLQPGKRSPAPEIKITTASVWMNERNECFHENGSIFQRVNIRDAGHLNIIEICYENGKENREIRIPIPKGKLREAIRLQEELLYRHQDPARAIGS